MDDYEEDRINRKWSSADREEHELGESPIGSFDKNMFHDKLHEDPSENSGKDMETSDKEMDDIIGLDETLSDDEVFTAAGVLKSLEEAWLNEKLSPEILPHKIEQVDCMMEQIHHMEENLKKLDKNDFRVGLHKLELDRIRYLITSYLRTRIDKIETYTLKVLEDESTRDPSDKYLSPSEFSFAKDHISNMNVHFKSLFVGLPESLQDLHTNQIMIKPNLESHVFVKANTDVQGVIVDDGDNREEEVSLEERSQHILPYKAVSDYIKNGQVQLI